ncbi:MAG: hypothetical protein ACOC2M_05145 [bacterium]
MKTPHLTNQGTVRVKVFQLWTKKPEFEYYSESPENPRTLFLSYTILFTSNSKFLFNFNKQEISLQAHQYANHWTLPL